MKRHHLTHLKQERLILEQQRNALVSSEMRLLDLHTTWDKGRMTRRQLQHALAPHCSIATMEAFHHTCKERRVVLDQQLALLDVEISIAEKAASIRAAWKQLGVLVVFIALALSGLYMLGPINTFSDQEVTGLSVGGDLGNSNDHNETVVPIVLDPSVVVHDTSDMPEITIPAETPEMVLPVYNDSGPPLDVTNDTVGGDNISVVERTMETEEVPDESSDQLPILITEIERIPSVPDTDADKAVEVLQATQIASLTSPHSMEAVLPYVLVHVTPDNVLYTCGDPITTTVLVTNTGTAAVNGTLNMSSIFTSNNTAAYDSNITENLLLPAGDMISRNYTHAARCARSENMTLVARYVVINSTGEPAQANNTTQIYVDNEAPSINNIVFEQLGEEVGNNGNGKGNIHVNVSIQVSLRDDSTANKISACVITFDKDDYSMTQNITDTGVFCNASFQIKNNKPYKYTLFVNDSFGNSITPSERTYRAVAGPHVTKYGGRTTNGSTIDDSYNVSPFTLEDPVYGLIEWIAPVNISQQDFDSYVNISENFVQVNASALDISLNSTSNITLYNLIALNDPVVFADEGDGFAVCRKCVNVTYNATNNSLRFITPSYTAFTVQSGTTLEIYDDNDHEGGNLTSYAQTNVTFFANYTNSSGLPIVDTGTFCNFTVQINSTYQPGVNMSYDAGSKVHVVDRVFSTDDLYNYNTSCFSPANANITLLDNISLTNSVPAVPQLVRPADGDTTGSNRSPEFVWNNGFDTDSEDIVQYDLQIDDNSDFSSPLVDEIGLAEGGTNETGLNITSSLNPTIPYYWRVRANDSTNVSDWSVIFNLTVLKVIDCNINPGMINFGSLGRYNVEDTTDDTPLPMGIENTGNVLLNVTTYADWLWQSTDPIIPAVPNDYYTFKIRADEPGAYTSALDLTWINLTNVSADAHKAIHNLKWEDASDQAKLDVGIKVPGDEPGTGKQSVMTITCDGNE
jgi:hypothetical protein